jgi:hypothetical protein
LAGFNIAVHDAGRVRCAQRTEQRQGHRRGTLGGQRPALVERLGQRDAVDQPHDDPGALILDEHVVDGHHIRVLTQLRGVPGLSLRPGEAFGALLGRGDRRELDFLDRDLDAEPLVVGLPHAPHATRAEFRQQPVDRVLPGS